MPRGGRGGLIGIIGQGVGMAAEYREHRKEQKLSRENSQQDVNAAGGSSSRPQQATRAISSSSDLPPAYADVTNEKSGRSIAAGKPPLDEKKAAMTQYQEDSSDDDDDLSSVEDDEEDWELDEALERSNSSGPPSYEESVQDYGTVDDLVREVMTKDQIALSRSQPLVRQPLPCAVILPQKRPGKKTRGFVRAYAPLLGECSGINQDTFLAFLDNFDKSSQASPIFGVIQLAAGIAGFAPSVIAMAVTTAVQVGARVGAEVQARQRTNSFLDKMNEELFQPAGLYAMIVKYKSDAEVQQSGNSLLARFGVGSEQVNFNTNQTIAKYDRTLPDESTGSGGSRGMSERMQKLRLASGSTRGAMQLPKCAPLIFPKIDAAIARDGPETFKDKAKDAKSFLADYMDRRAQVQYAKDDPNSALALPEEQRAFRSKLANPDHPMYRGGLVGFVSGGKLTQGSGGFDRGAMDRGAMDRGYTPPRQDRRMKRHDKDERRVLKYEQRMAHGRDLSHKKQRRYERYLTDEEMMHGRGRPSSYGGGPALYGGRPAPYGGGPAPYGGSGRRSGGGLVGGLISAATGGGRNREYEDSYDGRATGYDDPRVTRRSFDSRYGEYDQNDSYGGGAGSGYGYGNSSNYPSSGGKRRGGSGLIGTVKRVMKEDVLYLLIVNMPSNEELAEARELLARAKSGR